MLKKVDVSIYDTFAYIEKPPSINLNNNNFYVGFGLETPEKYNPFIDKTIYDAKAFFKEGKRNGGEWMWQTEEIEIVKCNLEYFGENFREKFKTNSIDNLYCLKEINKTFMIYILFSSFSYFHVEIVQKITIIVNLKKLLMNI